MQSVLVTVDRHEWYAPPLIYTRDDSTGLWSSKPALEPNSILSSSAIKDLGVLAGEAVELSSKATCMGHTHCDGLELTDGHGVTSMETSCENVSDEAHSRDEVDVEVKKRRAKEDLSTDGNLVSDYTLHGTTEAKLDDSVTLENAVTMDYQSAPAVAANASLAERMIEPTLVMFEVIL